MDGSGHMLIKTSKGCEIIPVVRVFLLGFSIVFSDKAAMIDS